MHPLWNVSNMQYMIWSRQRILIVSKLSSWMGETLWMLISLCLATSNTTPEPASTVDEEEEEDHESITKRLGNTIVQQQQPSQQEENNTSLSDDSIHQDDESTFASSSTGDLGGWGSTLDISWQSRSSFGSRSSSDSSSNGSSSVSGHCTTTSARASNYEHAWRQVAKEAPIITAKRVAMADDVIPDGWGTPKQVVKWDDSRLAYAHDVVEKQKSTTFWIKRDDGGWIKATDEPAPTTTATTATTTSHFPRSRRKYYNDEESPFPAFGWEESKNILHSSLWELPTHQQEQELIPANHIPAIDPTNVWTKQKYNNLHNQKYLKDGRILPLDGLAHNNYLI